MALSEERNPTKIGAFFGTDSSFQFGFTSPSRQLIQAESTYQNAMEMMTITANLTCELPSPAAAADCDMVEVPPPPPPEEDEDEAPPVMSSH